MDTRPYASPPPRQRMEIWDYVVADQGDILDEQPQHPLAVSRRRARIIPDTRQVGDQRGHPFLHFGSDRRGLGFACTRIRVFGFGQPLERLVPVAFQVVGDEPILGPHEQELPLRQLGVFAKPRNLRSFGAIDLGSPDRNSSNTSTATSIDAGVTVSSTSRLTAWSIAAPGSHWHGDSARSIPRRDRHSVASGLTPDTL